MTHNVRKEFRGLNLLSCFQAKHIPSKKDKMDAGKVHGCIDFRKMANVPVFPMKGMGDTMSFIGVYPDVLCKLSFKFRVVSVPKQHCGMNITWFKIQRQRD